MTRVQQSEPAWKGRDVRITHLGGAASGVLILAASALLLINVVYRALQAQAFDQVVAAMIGVVAVYSLIGLLLIVAFAAGRETTPQPVMVRASSRAAGSGSPFSVSEDGINA